MYKRLEENKQKIFAEARKAADEIGIPKNIRGKFGLTGAISGVPGLLTRDVSEAIRKAHRQVIPNARLADDLRDVVKDVYGDEYDAAATSTCEAALWISFDVLATPPIMGRGSKYRSRYIAPLERHTHHQAAYGRPFPPKYKDFISGHGATEGELGVEGKRQENLDTILVPLVGAKYECHGLNYHPVPLLLDVDPDASAKKMEKVAERHGDMLTAFTSLGYDTPGYGYKVKDDGVPRLQKLMGTLAKEYDVPYIVDNAFGLPFVGTDIRRIEGDLMLYSMDKAVHAPTSGLIIGKEDVMVSIRRALGIHGQRYGTTTSYGKAEYVTADPGKDALVGQIAALRKLRDEPKQLKKRLDALLEIVSEEFEAMNDEIRRGILISGSNNFDGVEINYQGTWKDEQMGIPIFSIDDLYSGTGLISGAIKQMGMFPAVTYDANCKVTLGLGTTDEKGGMIEERVRYATKGLVRAIEIVYKYAKVPE